MIVSILQENLLKALMQTGRNISAKTQLPIMQHALLVAKDGGLSVTTTNLETTERSSARAKVEKEGSICVPARLFGELALSLAQETVHLRVSEGGLVVECAGTKATLPGIAAAEFPPIPGRPASRGASLPKATLINALAGVLFAAAMDEGRPVLTGAKIVIKDGKAVFAATDGYRLSVKRLGLPKAPNLTLVVPGRALGEVVKVSQEEKTHDDLSLLSADGGQLVFVIGDTEVFTRPIDAEYPNFEKIIPTSHTTRVLLARDALARAVKSAALFARDNANIVRFHIKNQTLVVSANTPQVGENQVDVGAKVDGEGGEIAFNSRFLLDFLANFTEDELLFEMTGSLNPGAFKPVKDDSYLHIIMPVRVQS